MQSVESPSSAPGPWAPMRVRTFRALWIAALASNIGTYMQIVGASWAMTERTDSELLVALLQTAWAAPGFLLALHAGAWSDILDRRIYLAGAELAALVVLACLAVLQVRGLATPAILIGATFLESAALMLAAPAFLAVALGLVDTRLQPQALGLDAISRNIAQSVGPAVGGLLIAVAGPAAVFGLTALSFVGVVYVVLRILPPDVERAARAETNRGVHRAIREGVVTVLRSQHLRRVAMRMLVFMTCTAVLAAVMPLVARERLGVGATGFGLLWVALGLGAVGVLQVMPVLRSALGLDRLVLLGAVVWSVAVAMLSSTTTLWVALAALLASGAGAMTVLNTLFPAFTMKVPAHLLGRGASMAILSVWLGSTVGAALWGVVAARLGVDDALRAAAIVTPVVMLASRWLLTVGDPLRASD